MHMDTSLSVFWLTVIYGWSMEELAGTTIHVSQRLVNQLLTIYVSHMRVFRYVKN